MDPVRRSFTGVWVPKDVLLSDELSALQKIIYAEISSFEVCFMTNKFFADRYDISESAVSKNIAVLKKAGFVKEMKYDGRLRRLQAKHIAASQTSTKRLVRLAPNAESDYDECATRDNNIDTNRDNNINNTCVAPKKAQVVLEKPKPDLTPLSSAQVREYWDKILQEDKKNVGLRIVARFFLKKGDQFGFSDASRSQLQEIIRANIRAGAKCAVFDRAKIDNGITKVLSSTIGREARVETLYKTLTK